MNLEMIGIEQTGVCMICMCMIAKQLTAAKNFDPIMKVVRV